MSPETASSLVLHLYWVLAISGLVVLVATAWFWTTSGKYYAEWYGKVASEIVKVIAAAGPIATTFSDSQHKGLWFWPMVLGIACLGIWAVLSIILESRAKAFAELAKAALGSRVDSLEQQVKNCELELAENERAADNLMRLTSVLSESVNRKAKRLTVELHSRGGNPPRINQVRNALTPKPHLNDLLEALAAFFSAQIPEDRRRSFTFRVGVYVESDGVMTPVHGVRQRDAGYIPFKSFREHRDRFRLDSKEPAHVVQVVRTTQMLIVEDCEAASASGAFFYFDANQPNYLRSMVSYYCGSLCIDNEDKLVPVVIVVDTDATGFFRESDRESIRYCLHEFGVRVKLELLLTALVEGTSGSHEQRHNAASEASLDPDARVGRSDAAAIETGSSGSASGSVSRGNEPEREAAQGND